MTKDADGFDNDPVPLGSTLVDSVDKLDAGATRTVRTTVEGLLNSADYAHIDKRAEVQKAILSIVEEVKAERGGNVQDATYRRFLDAGKKAVSVLKRED